MSGQERRQDVYEYSRVASSAPAQEAQYPTYAPPQFALQAQQPHMTTSYGPIAHQPPYSYALQPHPHHGQHLPYVESPPRLRPEITAYHPGHGSAGTTITVHLRSNLDLAGFQPPLGFTVFFRNSGAPGSLTRMHAHDHGYHYTVAANVPAYESKQWMETLPLYLSINNINGQHLNFIYIGDFVFDIPQGSSRQSPNPDLPRKRKTPVDEAASSPVPTKRPSLQRLHDSGEVYRDSLPTAATRPSPTQAGQQQTLAVPSTNSQTRTPGYLYDPHPAPLPLSSQPRDPTTYTSQAHLSTPKPWSPSAVRKSHSPTALVDHRSQSPPAGLSAQDSRHQATCANSSSGPPALIRTSTLHTQPPASTYDHRPSQPFNPYSIYPNKAILNLQGDLDDMANGWDKEEWESHRRLVEFHRQQEENAIIASFQAVKPESRAPKSICISCIWWEEKQEAYVTSVDTIFLLESLVAVRFTVEEKNRIRRNLEGFRPLTVSKGRTESEDFFKIIMGFPNPKPRNIEKDVKVFPWKILSHALKKIIGKYSASYASTAGTLLPQAYTAPSSITPQSSPDSTSSSPALVASTKSSHASTQAHMSSSAELTETHLDHNLDPRAHHRFLPHGFQEQQRQQAYAPWMARQGLPGEMPQYHMSTQWEQFGVPPHHPTASARSGSAAPDYALGHFMTTQDRSHLPSDLRYDRLDHQSSLS